ncbi:N-acetylmuramoyl-L-alanine amidase [Ihubacter massiliensis]|uniref:N-acetylmuramoyl-L-alanine amidase n=1 Tax=Ihubacter massiliensis TaxID=1852367 RepID=UPI0020969361|nr:N-acetylmuramoyl-L-alanine amidase [Ihubacter massiliensis]MCO7122193.1 N-acetylmuramoyl-L-alanine amidase [Ihubacter massiliensis]
MKKRLIQAGICIGLLLLAVAFVPGYSQIVEKVASVMETDVLLIDPGHGGIDGGAESGQGVSEKAINLAISQEVKALAEAAGWQVVMTRDTDTGLYEEGSGTIRSLKTQDLKARRDLIDKTDPVLAVSIHLNSFKEDPSVRGMQVFYPGSGGEEKILKNSKKLAETLQEKVGAVLENNKKRVALPKTDVFLFKEVTCPIAIIECGFLSNPRKQSFWKAVSIRKNWRRGFLRALRILPVKSLENRLKLLIIPKKTRGVGYNRTGCG